MQSTVEAANDSRHARILLTLAEWEAVETSAKAEGRTISAMLGQLVRQALARRKPRPV